MYTVYYDPRTGEPQGIKKGENTSFGFNPDNTDFAEFLKWNAEQATPLDWQTPIAPAPPSADEVRRAALKARLRGKQTLTQQEASDLLMELGRVAGLLE